MRMPSVRSLALVAVVALGAVPALAQAPYPNHTIKILVGLARPTAGTATVAGIDCSAEPRKVKRLIGYMPDTFGSYDNMRVSEYHDFFGAGQRGLAREVTAHVHRGRPAHHGLARQQGQVVGAQTVT